MILLEAMTSTLLPVTTQYEFLIRGFIGNNCSWYWLSQMSKRQQVHGTAGY